MNAELSWINYLWDLKQDWIMFKIATKHQFELRLHSVEPKILTDLVF